MGGPEDSVFNQLEKAPVAARPALALNARYWSNFCETHCTLQYCYVLSKACRALVHAIAPELLRWQSFRGAASVL